MVAGGNYCRASKSRRARPADFATRLPCANEIACRPLQDLADASRLPGQADEKAVASVRALFDCVVPDERNDLEYIFQLANLKYQSPK